MVLSFLVLAFCWAAVKFGEPGRDDAPPRGQFVTRVIEQSQPQIGHGLSSRRSRIARIAVSGPVTVIRPPAGPVRPRALGETIEIVDYLG
jgi:hypothetical protein